MEKEERYSYLKSFVGREVIYRENQTVLLATLTDLSIQKEIVCMKLVTTENLVHKGGIELRPSCAVDHLSADPDRWVLPYIVINLYFDPRIVKTLKPHFFRDKSSQLIHEKLYAILGIISAVRQ